MLCIIQARMSSSRLPGKMLMDINGKTLLKRVFDRVSLSKNISKIIVATSNNKEDDKIKKHCDYLGINCFRGDLSNVAKRFMDLISTENVSSFVRINGDSPLIPPLIIDYAIKFFKENDFDLVTNVFPRTFPKGFSVEVISSKSFMKINSSLNKNQQEHITRKYYDNPEEFKIFNIVSHKNYSDINYCVDTLSDLKRINKLLSESQDLDYKLNKYCKNYK